MSRIAFALKGNGSKAPHEGPGFRTQIDLARPEIVLEALPLRPAETDIRQGPTIIVAYP
jgi:hypothetical protein